jgi:hypothetical protein
MGIFSKTVATAHTANATMVTIQEVFEDKNNQQRTVASQAPRSQFLNFYIWGNLKVKVFKNKPHSIEALYNEITHITGSITIDQLQKVSHNLSM